MNEVTFKSVIITVGLGIVGHIAWHIFSAYRRFIKPSKFMLAAQKLGFIGYYRNNGDIISMEEQQEALLKVFQMAGYFNLSKIWRDLNSIGGINNIYEVYEDISVVVKLSNADQSDPTKFNAKYMRENLLKNDNIDVLDAIDLILYIAQHAFTRQAGQERYEITRLHWIDTYAAYYAENARLLRLMDREKASFKEYDGAWIAGAARASLLQRIIYFNQSLLSQNLEINGETLVLAGMREIWANIDGILPTTNEKMIEAYRENIDIDTISFVSSNDDESARIAEGKSYIMRLAQFSNISLNSSQPFIQYMSKDECPPDRFPNRVYANYDANETSKLTETLMSRDLLLNYSNHGASKIVIIDTASQEQMRPNTASTVRDAAERLVRLVLDKQYGEKKTFVILFCTNNPYIERQTLAAQQQVNQILEKHGLITKDYQIKIDGIGASCKQQLTIVHSELGALIAEKWKAAMTSIEKLEGRSPKRDVNKLLFQTRDNSIFVSNQPTIKNISLNERIKYWFNMCLTR